VGRGCGNTLPKYKAMESDKKDRLVLEMVHDG
jgi:hypothetical protein